MSNQKQRSSWWQWILLASVGAGLMYLSFRSVSFGEVLDVIRGGNYVVFIPVLLVSVVVYLSRVKRWQMLLRQLGTETPPSFLFASLATGYLVNFAVPRLGEISRVMILKRWLNIPVAQGLSTVVAERTADVICLALLVMTAGIMEAGNSNSLLWHFVKPVTLMPGTGKLLLLLALAASGTIMLLFIRKRKDRFSQWVNELMHQFKLLLQLEQKAWFLFHTLMIWVGFYLMTYLWIFFFPASSQLQAADVFLVMTLGVVARSLPIQAGSAGAYHFVVSQAFVLLGIDLITGNALAVVIHGFQSILTLVLGAGAYLWLLNKR